MKKVIARLFALFVVTWALAACSVKMEVGYHGQTGRLDTTDSQRVKSANGAKHY